MNEKQIIATRPHKALYRQGELVVKVFDSSYPKADVLAEALNQARIEETGLPVPKIHAVSVTEDGKWSIVYDFVEGVTLEQRMAEEPEKREAYMRDFVALQMEVHSKTEPKLNKLKDKWDGKIAQNERLSAATRYELRARLGSMPKHTKVLHGDFNPSNIIVDPEGRYHILDWSHATQGNAAADAATTYLLFSLKDPALAELYLDLYCEMSGTEKRYVQRWLPVTAASRLGKEIPEEQALLERWLDVVEYQ